MDSTLLFIIIVAAIIVVILVATAYNSLISLRNKVKEAFATMDVYLKKRHDLVPSLVTVVKGYAHHEAQTLQDIAQMRNPAASIPERIGNETQLHTALERLMVVAEAYPELKANSNFLDLQNQLTKIEEDIAFSRRYYNGAVREFNNKCQMFPSSIIAGMFGFKPATMFEASADDKAVPTL